ncbi:uncharacterized protein L203_104723 [Cryptococcus depauperatus CBS 7841]|uniref:DDT domain-containing protein n=1 Tax=Cryptococcus depauperatus CBS 7841 TaxID=1295531 RepID=A0AAJ8JW16_9TREE
MPLLKRKPVPLVPLPSLSTVLQPVPAIHTDALVPQQQLNAHIPEDAADDGEQMHKLLTVFSGELLSGKMVVAGKKKVPLGAKYRSMEQAVAPLPQEQPPLLEEPPIAWKIHDRDTFYIPETGEIFTDYESFSLRKAFYDQQTFQCEVTGKQSLPYLTALNNERKETATLHAKFPRGLKRAVLGAVQFRKLETLADKIYERFQHRFFPDERVFVELQDEKYLATIAHITLSPSAPDPFSFKPEPTYHTLASDLHIPIEEVNAVDDPMSYKYGLKLVRNEDVGGEGIEVEVAAEKISRDRLSFSRSLLKRFIRDSVDRDPAVYSPWVVKSLFSRFYAIPTEMTPAQRAYIAEYREKQMGKRKREREERLGLNKAEDEDGIGIEEEEVTDRPRTKREKKEDEKRAKEDKAKRKDEDRRIKDDDDERKKRKSIKFPNEDLLVEEEKDESKIKTRPAFNRNLPFGDQFEKFLMCWSFLNVFGTPLELSPFAIDDFEQSLYHSSAPTPPLLAEIHASLLNALVSNHLANYPLPKPLSSIGRTADDDREYWEGANGATTEMLNPICEPLAEEWKQSEITTRDGRRGWENALVGCLWERATLEALPDYLDNILHLTFEPKPAPTRPTWSTGPSSSSSTNVIASKPSSRYSTLHHTHKLNIIAWLIELVGQTERVRVFLDESVSQLTEVRKEQVDVKREFKKIVAERGALDPKEKPADMSTEGDSEVKAEGEVEEDIAVNGHSNGYTNGDTREEDDELEDDMAPFPDVDMDEDIDMPENNTSHISNEDEEPDEISAHSTPPLDHAMTTASRRRAMVEKARSRAAEEAFLKEKAAKERKEAQQKKAEGKFVAAEKKRLDEEVTILRSKLRQLDYNFRAHIFTLRPKPLGVDRFGNRIWWFDAQGSAPMLSSDGKISYGTGRLYIQAPDENEEMYYLQAANGVFESLGLNDEIKKEDLDCRRDREEGPGQVLGPGEWGYLDEVDHIQLFMDWLNPKGLREKDLLKSLTFWRSELEGGIQKRRLVMGLDATIDNEESITTRRIRPTRRAAGDEETAGYMAWRNKRTSTRE